MRSGDVPFSLSTVKGGGSSVAKLALEPDLQIIRRSRRPLLRGLEQARRSALAHHVHRIASMGARVLINGIRYYRRIPFATEQRISKDVSGKIFRGTGNFQPRSHGLCSSLEFSKRIEISGSSRLIVGLSRRNSLSAIVAPTARPASPSSSIGYSKRGLPFRKTTSFVFIANLS